MNREEEQRGDVVKEDMKVVSVKKEDTEEMAI